MGEGDALAVELDHLRLDSRPKMRVGVGVQRGIEQRHRRLSERGCMDKHLVRLLRQGREALLDERAQRWRHWEFLVETGDAAASFQRAGELERVKRVASGDLAQPRQRRPRKRHPKAQPDQCVKSSEAQWRDLLSVHPLVRERGGQRRGTTFGLCRPHREKQGNGQLVEPTRSEGKGGRRWRVDPLRIIDRDHDWPARGERSQHGQRRDADCTPIGPTQPGIVDKECCLERLSLRGRQLRRNVCEPRPEQVAKDGMSQLRLGLGRSRRENGVSGSLGCFHPGHPERGLADSRLSLKDDGAGKAAACGETLVEDGDLLVAADQLCPCRERPHLPPHSFVASACCGRGEPVSTRGHGLVDEVVIGLCGRGAIEAMLCVLAPRGVGPPVINYRHLP